MGSSKKSKKQKEKKKRRKHSSSDSSSSSNDEDHWVEATIKNKSNDVVEVSNTKKLVDRDDWMNEPLEFSGLTRDQLRKKKEPKEDESKYMLDRLGQTDRELNPYWKDGGTGLPEQVKELSVTKAAVGDYGVEWLKKALQRAKEQAEEEGRRLEDVVAERWGSLEKLQSMIKEAESKSQNYGRSHKYNSYDKNKDRGASSWGHDKSSRSHSSKYEERFSRKGFKKPDEHESAFISKDTDKSRHQYSDKDEEKRSKDRRRMFMKPSEDEEISRDKRDSKKMYEPSVKHASRGSDSCRGWRKPTESQSVRRESSKVSKDDCDRDIGTHRKGSGTQIVETESSAKDVHLTADERNELAAKLIKAEIMGNTDLVEKLKAKLEQARLTASKAETNVLLTVTDSKGFVQPLALASNPEYSKRRKEKTQTHESGKRVRYFADDDKYSLQQMFEQEKRSTVQDQNQMFARLASKNVGVDEGANDMDDVFEDMVRVKESDGKNAAKERDRAISQYRRNSKVLDSCQWCLDGKHLLKHLVIAIGSKVFLCVPSHESLTEGHCMIVPSQHVACATQLDEDVWEEMKVFRKALVDMFLSMDLDVVFFECAVYLSRLPHMVLQCVPLPKESGDLAPIYFKKAILECEMEWATNKKLVDLAGKDVRRAIPRELPYFAVDFGMQSGFAHVIEDEKAFPKNFAQEIIGGMIDADHWLWRKPKSEKFEEQRKKVIAFTKWWHPFKCVK